MSSSIRAPSVRPRGASDSASRSSHPKGEVVPEKMRAEGLRAWFGKSEALKGITLGVAERRVTAIIGPSGCGKSTFVRCLNRMHEVVPGARVEGRVLLDGTSIYGRGVDPVRVRRRVGMVFQKPNPFPTMSIRDNVLAGLRLNGERPSDPDVAGRTRAAARPRCGTRSRTASTGRARACRAASSSACASRARWRSSPRSC